MIFPWKVIVNELHKVLNKVFALRVFKHIVLMIQYF